MNNHLLDRRLLARDIGERRRLASVVLRLLQGRGLLAFSASDDHLHLLLQGSREEAGESMRIVEIGLQRNFR